MYSERLGVRIHGLTPTLMHNGQLADPLNKWSKEIKKISAKKSKMTDDDRAAMQKYEWMGGLYVDDQNRPCWPGENIEAMIRTGAKATRAGKDVQRGVIVEGMFPVEYDGPRDLDALFEDDRFRLTVRAKIKQSSVMRTRPIFPQWDLSFEVRFSPEHVNLRDLKDWIEYAITNEGLSDWRPKYGRGEVVKFDE